MLLDVSRHYSYVRFCIDSENAFNMLPSSQCRCHQLSRVAEIQAQHRIRQCIGLEDFAEVTKYLTTQLRCASVFFEAILHLKLYKFGANPRILIYNNETKLHTISKDYSNNTILTDCVVQTWRIQGLHKAHSQCQSQITQEYYVATPTKQ